MPLFPPGSGSGTASCGTVLSGATITAAEIQFFLDALTLLGSESHQKVLYVCGDVVLEAPLAGRSFVTVDFGPSNITTTLAPPVGSADDPQNHLFGAQGTIDAVTLDTTLTADGNIGDSTITVAAVGALAVGQYVVLSVDTGTAGSDLYGSGAGSILIFEIRKVVNIAGLVLTLDAPLLEFFSSVAVAARVRRVLPVRNVEVIGGYWDASGGSIASGIMAQYALDVQLIGQRMRGFSRSALDLELAAQNFLVEDYVRVGETNSDVLMNSAHEGRIINFDYVPGGARQHANGFPRGNVTFRGRSASDQLLGGRLGGGNIGIQVYGGLNPKLADVTITDCNPAERITRCGPGNLDGYIGGAPIGAGIDTGADVVATLADFFFGLEARGVKIENVDTSATAYVYAASLHDGQSGDVELEVINLGVGTSMRGISISDVNGDFPLMKIRGTTAAITWQNGNYTNHFGETDIREQGGSGGTYNGAPLVLNLALAAFIEFDRLTVSGSGGGNLLGLSAAVPVGTVFRAKQFTFDGVVQTLDEVYLVQNDVLDGAGNPATLPLGSVVELDPTTDGQVIAAGLGGSPARFLTVVKGPADDTATLSSFLVAVTKPGNASQVRVAAAQAVVPGDPLRHGAGGDAIVDAAATNDSLGIAVTSKAAGAAALVATR